MKTDKSRFIAGCIVAPLEAPLSILLIILVAGEDLRGPSYEYGLNDIVDIFGIAGMFLVLGAPIAYTVMVVFGFPIYFLAKKLGYINFWSVTFGSAFVAVFPLLLMFAKNAFIIYDEPQKSSLLFYLAFAFTGYLVGLVFWFISGTYKQSSHNNQLNQGAPKSGAPVS